MLITTSASISPSEGLHTAYYVPGHGQYLYESLAVLLSRVASHVIHWVRREVTSVALLVYLTSRVVVSSLNSCNNVISPARVIFRLQIPSKYALHAYMALSSILKWCGALCGDMAIHSSIKFRRRSY